MTPKPDNIKAHCNICGGAKNHILLFEHERKWKDQFADDPSAFCHGKDHYELMTCAGCDGISFRHTAWFSEDYDDDGRPIPTVSYYPSAKYRRLPSWLSGMEGLLFMGRLDFVPRLLNQVYSALHNSSYSLAAMGIRAILELMIVDCVGDHDSFFANLKEFEKQGYLGSKQRKVIETTLEAGHAAIHRNYNPSKQDVIQTLDITENLLQATYINESHAETLKKKIPSRKKKPLTGRST